MSIASITSSSTTYPASDIPMPAIPPPAGQPESNIPAIDAAQQALANANALVAQDERNHSPSCVAVDEKRVDAAQLALAQARQTASGSLDISL